MDTQRDARNAPEALTTDEIAHLRVVGRRAAVQMGCEPDDGEQQAYLEALESLRCCPGYRGAALVDRVHKRLRGERSSLRRHAPIWAGELYAGDAITEEGGE